MRIGDSSEPGALLGLKKIPRFHRGLVQISRGESPLRYRLGNVLQLLSRKRKRAVFSGFSHGLLADFGYRPAYPTQ